MNNDLPTYSVGRVFMTSEMYTHLIWFQYICFLTFCKMCFMSFVMLTAI